MNARQFALGALVVAVAAAPVLAQTSNPQCQPNQPGSVVPASGSGGNACQQAIDLFNYLAPQLGTAIAGGNATIGRGGTLGGLGHFAFTARATALRGDLPDTTKLDAGPVPATPTTLGTKQKYMPMVGVDGAIGLFNGIPLGVTRILGIDALGSLFYVPDFDKSDVEVSIKPTDGKIKLGFGARVGIIGETKGLPGVAVSWFRRDLPQSDINWRPTNGQDTIQLNGFENNTTEWRVTVGKKFGPLRIAGGYGEDKYESSANLRYVVRTGCTQNCPATPLNGTPLSFSRDTKATNMFAGVQLNLVLFKLVGEVGQVKLKDVDATSFYNTFDQPIDRKRLYASAGITIGR